ncbi:hypothetical protein PHET_03959 [Paragonimus heterotremus]|uniref:Secreted protein n=1 Tax=Paragonimus heterotremus TaxID=100268 RepID=A0A8J4T1T4_9TREM|nr:hypothetical protein PHET_03959 [Paragonimus heterotremus]
MLRICFNLSQLLGRHIAKCFLSHFLCWLLRLLLVGCKGDSMVVDFNGACRSGGCLPRGLDTVSTIRSGQRSDLSFVCFSKIVLALDNDDRSISVSLSPPQSAS